ncbi:MAG: glycosyltransferase [Dysgonamonadaceae bacterium]|nr:glycosyltransferase [Dysgonamonadaceae bacterium]
MERIDILILTALFVCWVVQMIYYWVYLAKPYYYQRAVDKGKIAFSPALPPVSLIIYTRNEARNLEKYLPDILEQAYPLYEVIVVDDCSCDDTEDLLKHFRSQYKHLYYTYVPPDSRNVSRKKLALTLGIKAARYDNLLFLEAGSYPTSPDWLRLMARHFVGNKTIVLGFSTLKKCPMRYAVYDYFFSGLQMMALALMHRAYMGNGKNLGYAKSEFMRQRVFSDFSFLEAGDDDLLIGELAGPDNVSVELSPDSVIQVNMEELWSWKKLKIQRMTTWPFYRKFPIAFWNIEKLSRMLFYLLFMAALVWFSLNWEALGAVILLFLLRFLTQGVVINRTTRVLKLPKFGVLLLIFDFIQPLVNGYFYLCKRFKSRRQEFWKYGK